MISKINNTPQVTTSALANPRPERPAQLPSPIPPSEVSISDEAKKLAAAKKVIANPMVVAAISSNDQVDQLATNIYQSQQAQRVINTYTANSGSGASSSESSSGSPLAVAAISDNEDVDQLATTIYTAQQAQATIDTYTNSSSSSGSSSESSSGSPLAVAAISDNEDVDQLATAVYTAQQAQATIDTYANNSSSSASSTSSTSSTSSSNSGPSLAVAAISDNPQVDALANAVYTGQSQQNLLDTYAANSGSETASSSQNTSGSPLAVAAASKNPQVDALATAAYSAQYAQKIADYYGSMYQSVNESANEPQYSYVA